MAVRAVKQDKATSRRHRPQSAPENTRSVPPAATEPAPAEATSSMSPSPDSAATSGPGNGSRHDAGEVSPERIPGAAVIGRGIYLKPRQPYELKALLFETGEDEAQFVWETGRSYLVPKGCVVNNSPPTPADESLGETVIEESWDRFGKELTLNVKAAVSSNLISIDPTAFRATDLRSEEDSYYALRSSFIAFWNISLINVPSAPTLEKEVANLPEDPLEPSNRAEYARIFDKYGSHYVKSAWVGGKASLVFIVAKSSQLTKDEIRAGIQAAVGGIVSGSMSSDQKTVGDRFKSNSTCKVFGSGGDRLELAKLTSLQEEAYGKWIQSVKQNPQVIELGLSGIWTLVKNPAKAEALKAAYIQETSFTPLTAIIPITTTFSAAAGVETRLTFLKGDEVFEYRLRQPPGGKRISRNPSSVVEFKRNLGRVPLLSKFARPDAAFSLTGFGEDLSDALYLFKHRECLRVDVHTLAVIDGYPKDIGEEWPGVDFDRIDAALAVAPDKIYFFRGAKYIRVDIAKGKPPVVASRDLIKKRWAGVSFDRLDTAVYWGNSKVYLFHEDQYIRYDMSMFKADPGYPRFIESNYVEDWELFD
jgi:MAC/Perforin domain/Hemopexin